MASLDLTTALNGEFSEYNVRSPYGILSVYDQPVNWNRSKVESAVWSFGKTYTLNERPGKVRAWQCSICKEFISILDGRPSNVDKHLQRMHRMFVTDVSRHDPSDRVSTTESQASSAQAKSIQPLISQMFDRPRANIKEWRRDLLQWLIESHIPFHTMDTPTFKRMMISANPALEGFLPANSTIRD